MGVKFVLSGDMPTKHQDVKLNNEHTVNLKHEQTQPTPSPNKVYNICLSEIFKRTELNRFFRQADKKVVILATHDEDAIRYTLQEMEKYAISPSDNVVCFSQLLGLGDHVSLPLLRSGYSVCKNIHIGTRYKGMAELIQSLGDGNLMLGNIEKEKELMWNEFCRRMKNGQIFYTPKGRNSIVSINIHTYMQDRM